jgi:CRP-like cAMP-binding protein
MRASITSLKGVLDAQEGSRANPRRGSGLSPTAATQDASPADGEESGTTIRNKLQRAGKKAARAFELTKAFDTPVFRGHMESFLQIPSDSRTEEDIDEFLKSALRFKFFSAYTNVQQRQLAKLARLRTGEHDEVLFKQEESPDGIYLVVNGRCALYKMQGDVKKLIVMAGQGDSVGDLTHLDERMRRSCTAQISSDHGAQLIMFGRTELDALSQKWRIAEEKAKTDFILQGVPVLNGVQRELVASLSPCFEKMHVPKDSIIYRQQDEASAIYFVWEGEVQLVKRIDLVKVSKRPT